MPAANTRNAYGSVTKTFHWLTALLILTLIPLGLIAERMGYDTAQALETKALLFSIHKTLGVTAFFVALLRILWALTQPKPGLLHAEKKAESFLAELVHWALYASLVLVPLTGWIHHAATTGFAPIFWPLGQNLPFVGKDEGTAALFGGLHGVFAKVLIASLLLHIAGALKHHVIDKDATLKRMWFGGAVLAQSKPHGSQAGPIAGAAAAYGLAIAIGAVFGIYAPHDAPVRTAALEQVQSDWQVTEGTLGITVSQFGSDVQGSFADWTADITFDETAQAGKHGAVTVQINISSLTLGSVTAQAMGPDFFDAEGFPTATFTADILEAEAGYSAEGTLTLKGTAQPVTLPFTLEIDGDTAVMTGQTTLNRMDYAIGTSQPDESSLKFPVMVDIALTASRAAQ
ncbi:cytochrome b/b6 domain-containing protein [Alphaproteobacteria bacterium KMM 3653]|uniref:Cytochrome b/b6 domain-containing protein n=1 Tax=Harenicola maris TaxID=2841044 RepID=A0AAP2CPX8_9RHOB|nr:cytochrome b/b6 domain-containing protein [Harenicola maris]